jgi:hypothetical protein
VSGRLAALAARRVALAARVDAERVRVAQAGTALVGPLAVVEVARAAGGELTRPPPWVRVGVGALRVVGFGGLGGLLRLGWAAWVGGRAAVRAVRVLRHAERALPT